MPPAGPQRWLASVAWLLLFGFAALLALQDIRSFDYWWLLRTGQLIVETGAIPRVDPYSYTAAGARWIDIHWLHQLGLYGLYSLGGHSAVVVGKAALLVALVALLAPLGYRPERSWLSLLALVLLLLNVCQRVMPRPELPSFVLLAAVLALLDRFERKGDAWLYAIVAIQLLWINVHGFFAVGIAVCAIHLAGELLRPLGASGGRLRWDRVRRLTTVTVLAALTSLANPNGLEGALYPLQQLGMVGSAEARGYFGRIIWELRPPLDGMKPLVLSFFLVLAAASLAVVALNWRRVRECDVLLWAAFFYVAVGARRNVALFAIVATPILVRNANSVLGSRLQSTRAWAIATALAALLLTGLVSDVASNRFYARMGVLRSTGLGVNPHFVPVDAVDWIEQARPPGPIAHEMADGGYLIWRLYPDYKVMSDGRLEVFGAELFETLDLYDPESFAALDRQHRFGTVFAHHSLLGLRKLLGWLYRQPDWRLSYVDDLAAVFVRAPEGGDSPYPEVDLEARVLFPPLDGSSRGEDMQRLESRVNLLLALGRSDLAIAVCDRARAVYPTLPDGALIVRQQRERLERLENPAAG